MQLGTYPRLNAALCARAHPAIDRFPFRYPLTRRRDCLASPRHDNEYRYLTGSSNVNKATPFQALARSDPSLLKYRVTRGGCWTREIPRARSFLAAAQSVRAANAVYGVIRTRYGHITQTKRNASEYTFCEDNHQKVSSLKARARVFPRRIRDRRIRSCKAFNGCINECP